MHNLKKILQTWPVFLLLLPVFFVLHTVVEYYTVALAKEALAQTGALITISLCIAALFWLLFRDTLKAGVITFFIMLFYLFFGSTHDFIKKNFNDVFIVKYSFILPFVMLLLVAVTILLKKTKKKLTRFTTYLNLLFFLLMLIDTAGLLLKLTKNRKQHIVSPSPSFPPGDTFAKPDIYLVLTDEYAGFTELKEIFSFDNSSFLAALKNRGFHVLNDSRSNYDNTVYSMASLLNMGYIENLDKENIISQQDVFSCRDLIKENKLIQVLSGIGYDIYNFSYFEIGDKKNKVDCYSFFPPKKYLFTSQTFTSRLKRDIGYHFPRLIKIISRENDNIHQNNLTIDSLTRVTAMQKNSKPRFIYSHFLMPHGPFYFDSTGRELNYNRPGHKNDNPEYVQYLLYTNKKILSLIDHIKSSSKIPSIIILMSDHGLRLSDETKASKYDFMTLNAVYYPNADYSGFYDGMTNVNQFRIVLNSYFGQNFSMLKDSSSSFREQ